MKFQIAELIEFVFYSIRRDCFYTRTGRLIAVKNVLETAKIETKKLTGYTNLGYNVFEQHKRVLRVSDVAFKRRDAKVVNELIVTI